MTPHWLMLSEREQNIFRSVLAFLDGRLEDRGAIDWALKLKSTDIAQRFAVLEILERRGGRKFDEPWQTAWGLIEESWRSPGIDDTRASMKEYALQDRLKSGDRSGALIAELVDLVAPRLKVEPFSSIHLHYHKLAKRPKNVSDLFSTGLFGGKLVDLSVLKVDQLEDSAFLLSLAYSLEAALNTGLDIERRIGPEDEYRYWHHGGLSRCYYVQPSDGDGDPDQFHHGIAPVVKLLHRVLSRIIELDIASAKDFVARLKLYSSPVHKRLWSAFSMNSQLTSAEEVGEFLRDLDACCFWNLHNFPEIAELRARRFSELHSSIQAKILSRIKKGPPRSQLKWATDAEQTSKIQIYWAIRELKRIEIAGGVLPAKYEAWIKLHINEFAELVQMSRLDEGFLEASKAHWVPPNPDTRYDFHKGTARLKELNEALQSGRRSWDDDPSQRARDWIRASGNCQQLIADFQSDPNGGASFPNVWEAFGWSHTPTIHPGEDPAQRDLSAECSAVLDLIAKLPAGTIEQSIDGISHWLSSWERSVVILPVGLSVWLKVWPIAVESTNNKQPPEQDTELDAILQTDRNQEPADLDTLNTPAGKLVGVFLVACPTVQPGDDPFNIGSSVRTMRNEIETVLGSSGSIVKYRLIEHLPYFLAADKRWAVEHLVPPLLNDSDEARMFWRAVARQRLSFEVLEILGDVMTDRAIDLRLGRETRNSLVFRIVIDCLYAFKDQRDPAINHSQIQQMIRSLDDEVRAHAAEAIQRFVRDLSVSRDGKAAIGSPEHLFRVSAAPFLQQVWPQERSLATPGVSKALADLPSVAGEDFAAAVDAVERFLVPFDCWSMLDYGLYGDDDGEPKLLAINDEVKASAFLKLLDLTIGTAERSVVPYDLANALDRIRNVAPTLVEKQSYRRLSTAARRNR